MADIAKYVGKQIRKFRLEKGLTQKQLGQMIGVKHNTISAYEAGVNEPDQNILFAIAKALGISINRLFPSIHDNSAAKGSQNATDSVGELILIPIVGTISCGDGSFAYEDIESYESIPREWLSGDGEHFFLRAKGDSMVGARIYDGDLLLIRKQSTVDDGDIAAVLINDDNEAVLKRVYRSEDKLILQSENPNYPPILAPPAEVKILGKLKMNVIKY